MHAHIERAALTWKVRGDGKLVLLAIKVTFVDLLSPLQMSALEVSESEVNQGALKKLHSLCSLNHIGIQAVDPC